MIHLAKKFYDRYPQVVKKLGLLELATFEPYRSFYKSRIQKKMESFHQGAITVEFEVTNKCNADCVMCPNSLMQRPHERMEMEVFKKIADEFASEKLPLIKFVFAGLGEPTLDPLLPEKIRYLKNKLPSVPVQVTTNASLLNETRAKALIESGLDLMIISFNGTSKESYESVMVGMKFDRTLENVVNFLKLRKGAKPAVTLSCVRLEANARDFASIEKFWNEKGVTIESFKTPIPFNRGGDQMKDRYKSRWSLEKPSKKRHMHHRGASTESTRRKYERL